MVWYGPPSNAEGAHAHDWCVTSKNCVGCTHGTRVPLDSGFLLKWNSPPRLTRGGHRPLKGPAHTPWLTHRRPSWPQSRRPSVSRLCRLPRRWPLVDDNTDEILDHD